MEWQAIVLCVQILILAGGYFLFQAAKAELNARAAETPVLGEIKSLQRSVKALVTEIETASTEASDRVAERCAEARALTTELETRLTALRAAAAAPPQPQPQPPTVDARRTAPLRGLKDRLQMPADGRGVAVIQTAQPERAAVQGTRPQDDRKIRIYEMIDRGETAAEIARRTGMSTGEVETLVGLRQRMR
jgi:hypothetical protein